MPMQVHLRDVLLSFAVGLHVAAGASGGPAFNCARASNATEKAICADARLSTLDREMAAAWRSWKEAFSDDADRTRLRVDQAQWMKRRNACAAATDCIATTYQDRLDELTGGSRYPFAGVYEKNGIGTVAVYPHAQGYRVSIQTADPQAGRWTCELTGSAAAQGQQLTIRVDGATFQARLQSDVLEVLPGDGTNEAKGSFCGNNGTFTYGFRRVK
jgi:uncharacterized protein